MIEDHVRGFERSIRESGEVVLVISMSLLLCNRTAVTKRQRWLKMMFKIRLWIDLEL